MKTFDTLIARYPQLAPCLPALTEAYEALVSCFARGCRLFVGGNGGSSADAAHIVGELMKGFVKPRTLPQAEREAFASYGALGERLANTLQGALPAHALGSETALASAFANDKDGMLAYAQELYGLAREGDVLLAISTSGNAENLLAAATVAREKGMKVIALTGESGGRLRAVADITIAVPEQETYRIQELHLPVYHALCLALEERFFGDDEDAFFIGVDIGGTKCAVVRGDRAGNILEKVRFETRDCESTLRQIEEAIAGMHPFRAIGISCGGPLDAERGVILSPPNLPGWDEVAITARFSSRFGTPVYLANDADACALAEWRFGAGRGTRNMIFLTFGTGLGAGLILDGKLYTGACGMAGEAGHIRLAPDGPLGYGKHGSFEGFCSGGGLARYAASLLAEEGAHGGESSLLALASPTAADIAAAARAGDALAIQILAACGEKLGQGLATLVDLFNPECIVIGSIFTRCEEFLRPAAERVLKSEALPLSCAACRLLPAALGESLGDVAALAVALCPERK